MDRFNFEDYRSVVLEAGYNSDLSLIFQGNLREAYSERSGVDIITRIDAWDGGHDIYNSITSETIAGLNQKQVVERMMESFPNIKKGKVGEIEGEFFRPVVLYGSTYELIKLYGGLIYVDVEKINSILNKEFIEGLIPEITSSTGLLGTPLRRDAQISIKTMFQSLRCPGDARHPLCEHGLPRRAHRAGAGALRGARTPDPVGTTCRQHREPGAWRDAARHRQGPARRRKRHAARGNGAG